MSSMSDKTCIKAYRHDSCEVLHTVETDLLSADIQSADVGIV